MSSVLSALLKDNASRVRFGDPSESASALGGVIPRPHPRRPTCDSSQRDPRRAHATAATAPLYAADDVCESHGQQDRHLSIAHKFAKGGSVSDALLEGFSIRNLPQTATAAMAGSVSACAVLALARLAAVLHRQTAMPYRHVTHCCQQLSRQPQRCRQRFLRRFQGRRVSVFWSPINLSMGRRFGRIK